MTHTFNSAAAVIHQLYGKMDLSLVSKRDRTVFTVNGKPVAQYRESTGILSFYPYGKELQKALPGARTLFCWEVAK